MQFILGICMKHLAIAFSLLVFFSYVPDIQADTDGVVLKGKVLNKNKEPMIGATVSANKYKEGVVVDMNGNYALHLKTVKFPYTLVVQYIGYKTAVVTINNYREARHSEIILQENNYSLDDVVVVGYGKSSRKKLTGSVAKVTSSIISQTTQEAPVMALQGNAAGIYIEQGSGVPGAGNSNVVIRGVSTLTSQRNPLYIIDGIPFNATGENPVGYVTNGVLGLPDALSFINPTDIESIEILKDADATAIYGTRGANGVILITTKKGQSGKIKVSAGYSATVGYVANRIDYLSTPEYLALRRKAYESDLAKGYLTEEDFTVSNYPDLLLWDQNADYDWQGSMMGNNSWAHDAQVQISGGSKNTSFLVSGSYYTANTVVISSDRYSRWSARANINHHSNDHRFQLESGVTFSGINMHAKAGSSPYLYLNTAPNTPLFDEKGRPYYIPDDRDYSSPTSFTAYDGLNSSANFMGNVNLSYKILDCLKAKVSMGYNYSSSDQTNKYGLYWDNPYDPDTYNEAMYFKMSTNTFLIEPQLSYDRKVLQGDLSALIGATYQSSSYSVLRMKGQDYPSDAFLDDITSAARVIQYMNPMRQSKTASFFARLTYDWNSKYLINGIFRRDGSSRFGPSHRFGNFYSVGTAWLFSNEKFIKNTKMKNIISHGKLRASFGSTGNDGIGDYAYMTKYSTNRYPYEGHIGMYPANLANEDLHWETTRKLDLGLELGLINDRVLFNLTWFRNRSFDLLTNENLPGQTGFSSIVSNLDAKIENRGWEIELNTQNIKTSNFVWKSSFNLTIPRNKLLKFKGLESSSYARRYSIGESVNVIKGYNYLGVDNQTGLPMFEDVNNDGKLTMDDDYKVLGSYDPQFYGGFTNTFNFKGFTLDVSLYFRKKTIEYGYLWRYMYPIGTQYNVPREMAENYWTTPGVDAKYPGLCSTSANPIYESYRRYLSYSQAAYSNGSYLRLRDVTLSYDFPQEWMSPLNISSLRLYVQGKNLFTFTKFDSFDPETAQVSVPALTSWVLGLNMTF